MQQAERHQGLREGLTTSERERLKALERENRKLRLANEILKTASAFFAHDNAMAEMINGLDKAEVIYRYGPWKNMEVVEYAPLELLDWFNHRRLLEPISNVPPVELEAAYFRQLGGTAMAA